MTQVILIDKEIAYLKFRQILPPQCDHTESNDPMNSVKAEKKVARLRSAAPESDSEVWEQLAVTRWDSPLCAAEVRGLMVQLANRLTMANRTLHGTPQVSDETVQQFPISA